MTDAERDALHREAERTLGRIVRSATSHDLLETTGQHDTRYWRHCIDQGWTAIGIPAAYGGIGLGLAELCRLVEVGGALAVGSPLLESGFAAGQAVLRHANETICAAWLPRLANGETSALLAIAEGGEPLPATPLLRWRDGHASGSRAAVPAAALADIAILPVATEVGSALALVDLRDPAAERMPLDTFDNSRGAADLVLRDAPASLLPLAFPERDLRDLVALQAAIAAHQQVGGAVAMLTSARDHALQRRAFGQPIGAFQSVKHRLAEDYVLIELARASADEAVAAAGSAGFARAAAAARLLATEAYETTTRDAVQIHGAMGVTWEADFHLHQRRARSLALELGATIRWEDLLVDRLTAEAA